MDSKRSFKHAFNKGYNATGFYKEIRIPFTYPRLVLAYKAGLKARLKDDGIIKRKKNPSVPDSLNKEMDRLISDYQKSSSKAEKITLSRKIKKLTDKISTIKYGTKRTK